MVCKCKERAGSFLKPGYTQIGLQWRLLFWWCWFIDIVDHQANSHQRSVVVITSALHAQGRRFEPGRWYNLKLTLSADHQANPISTLSQTLMSQSKHACYARQNQLVLRFYACITNSLQSKQGQAKRRDHNTRLRASWTLRCWVETTYVYMWLNTRYTARCVTFLAVRLSSKCSAETAIASQLLSYDGTLWSKGARWPYDVERRVVLLFVIKRKLIQLIASTLDVNWIAGAHKYPSRYFLRQVMPPITLTKKIGTRASDGE